MRFFIVLTLVGIIVVLVSTGVYSQDKPEQEIPNAPFFNFGSGLSIKSDDDLFKMNFRFRLQNRATYFIDQDENRSINGQIRRLRLRFDGHIGNPNLIYLLQLSFSPGDTGGEIVEGENLNIIRDAVIFYRAGKGLNIGFGQAKLPGNRQRVNSSAAMQLTDRTINNNRFNIDRDFGFFTNYEKNIPNSKAIIILRSAISNGEGRNFTTFQNTGLCFTNKIELKPFGKFKRDGAYFEGDVLREETPKLMLSGAYYYNHKTTNLAGQLGEGIQGSMNLQGWFIDAIFKYKGFAGMYAFMNRNGNLQTVKSLNDKTLTVFNGSGHDIQMSYFISKKWELILKHSTILTHKEIRNKLGNFDQTGIGLTRYLWQHAFKIQTEISRDRNLIPGNQNLNSYFARVQAEVGI